MGGYNSIALDDIFLVRGPFGLSNDDLGLQYFNIDIIMRCQYLQNPSSSLNHMMKYMDGKTLVGKILVN